MNANIFNPMPIPVLQEDSLDYPTATYISDVTPHGSSPSELKIFQRVTDSNLAATLLADDMAKFAVEISSPYTTFRKIEICERTDLLSSEHVAALSEIDVQPPTYLRPLLIANPSTPLTVRLEDSHAVHKSWFGTTIKIYNGSILGKGSFWAPSSTMQSLIRVVKDENDQLSNGMYEVKEFSGDGFYFKVKMHPAQFEVFQNPGEHHDHCRSVLVGALSRAFEILKEKHLNNEFGKEGTDLPPVLKALHAQMESTRILTWDVDGFCAEVAASQLRPLKLRRLKIDD